MKTWQSRRFDRIRVYADRSPPVRCHPDADVEVHTLSCREHLSMYRAAIKSLLIQHDDLAVVLHDDGSLTSQDARELEAHVPGIRIHWRAQADRQVDERLAGRAACRAFRQEELMGLQLFDYTLLGRRDRIITLDADSLFLDHPSEVIQWIVEGRRDVLHLRERLPHRQADVLGRLGITRRPGFALGLACFPTAAFDLDVIEAALQYIGPGARDRWTSQNLYAFLACQETEARALNVTRYQSQGEFVRPAVFRHYWSSHGLRGRQVRNTRRVLRALPRRAG